MEIRVELQPILRRYSVSMLDEAPDGETATVSISGSDYEAESVEGLTHSMLATSRSSAPTSSSLRPDSSRSAKWRMKAMGDEKPRFRVASWISLSVASENRIARWAM
jgi:hypothetical protein